MDFLIIPYKSVGPIEFGMTVNQVRELFDQPFKFTPRDDGSGDFYYKLGLKISYNRDGYCDAVELTPPANPILENRKLFKGYSMEKLKHWLGEMDPELLVENSLIVLSPQFGVGTYHDGVKGIKHKRPEWILVCSKEEYDAHIKIYNDEEDEIFKPQVYKEITPKRPTKSYTVASEAIIKLWLIDSIMYYSRNFGFLENYRKSTHYELYKNYHYQLKIAFKASFTNPQEWKELLWNIYPRNYDGIFDALLTSYIDPYLLRLDTTRTWTIREVKCVCAENQEYVKAFQRWCEISRGTFLPEDVQEFWDSETGPIRVEFTFNGERYVVYPEYCEQLLDLEILLDINRLIKKTGYQFCLSELIESKLVIVLTQEEEDLLYRERSLEFEGNYWKAWRR